ncbi:MAG TPA: YdbL family protein [Lacunisphaera sp.]|nr:YdbL family protein [Lacunisphaera sp.]
MKTRLLLIFAFLGLFAVAAFAQNAAEIRQRMEARIPAIDRLKAAEAIGENNRGLLELRPAAKSDAASVVTAENGDREAVYAIIAKQTGATPDSVAKARARQIAAGSRPGVWVQDESGAWHKK